MKDKNRFKFFMALVVFSLIGQVAWVVENMYFNVFIYEMFNASAEDIATMVSASAISATVTTLLIGALSDKLGKRKVFICGGYILWGISILSFALIKKEIIQPIFPMATSVSAICVTLVIIMDCVMTFFGSSANDACFNAWLTDATDKKDRGKVEGINSMMPLVAILVVFGGFMSFDLAKSSSWTTIFLVIGIVVILIGVLGVFLIRDTAIQTQDNQHYFKNIIYGFKPSVIKQNPLLYLLLIAFALFGISIQIFMPYLILYYTVSLQMADYVLIMAPAIVLASVFTALWGRTYDCWNFKKAILPTLALLCAGYVVLFIFKAKLLVFVGSLLMMCGYLSASAIFGAVIRDNIPKNRSGMFQGLRIVSQVLIPGVVGPMIGKWILQNAEKIVNNDGTMSFKPNENIFLGALIVAVLVILFLCIVLRKMNNNGDRTKNKKDKHIHLLTEQGENFKLTEWEEYPRPQLKRNSFYSLNGAWTISINGGEKQNITVPFPPESLLSGVHKNTGKHPKLIYEKDFQLPENFQKDKVLLHFGAVDQIALVKLNGKEVGFHEGGYLPFSLDITSYLKKENHLTVEVEDRLFNTVLPYGKQSLKRGGMWYTPISGIWQTVWLESVPEEYIQGISVKTKANQVRIRLEGVMQAEIKIGEKRMPFQNGEITLEIENPQFWSPENPHLYPFKVMTTTDEVESYFALRDLEVKKVDGYQRLCLNGKPYFFHGVLDQGYYSDGIYTPASPKCYEKDISKMKQLGFNTLRKHIKIEPELFYYYCDKYGMIVFQDMVNNSKYSFLRDTALPTIGFKKKLDTNQHKNGTRRTAFEKSMVDTCLHLTNHPCICYWTIFNEGWGQFESQRQYQNLKALDDTRFIDTTSGWFIGSDSDVFSPHVYFKKVKIELHDKPILLSEFGGYSYKIENHSFNTQNNYGYGSFNSQEAFEKALTDLYEQQIIPYVKAGLCGAIYTQLSDVEDETNGLLTYDRKVCKVRPEIMQQLAEKLKIEG